MPSADLEMLFPNTEVRTKTIDKVMTGVPAAAGDVFMLVTKLGATLLLACALLAFWLGLSDDPVILDQKALLAISAGPDTIDGFLWKPWLTTPISKALITQHPHLPSSDRCCQRRIGQRSHFSLLLLTQD